MKNFVKLGFAAGALSLSLAMAWAAAPAQPLPKQTLAKQLGISDTPVTDASVSSTGAPLEPEISLPSQQVNLLSTTSSTVTETAPSPKPSASPQASATKKSPVAKTALIVVSPGPSPTPSPAASPSPFKYQPTKNYAFTPTTTISQIVAAPVPVPSPTPAPIMTNTAKASVVTTTETVKVANHDSVASNTVSRTTVRNEEEPYFESGLPRGRFNIGVGYVYSRWDNMDPSLNSGSFDLSVGFSRVYSDELEAGLTLNWLSGSDTSSNSDNIYAMNLSFDAKWFFSQGKLKTFGGFGVGFGGYRAWSLKTDSDSVIIYNKHGGGSMFTLTPALGLRCELNPHAAFDLSLVYDAYLPTPASRAGGVGLLAGFSLSR